MPISSITGQDVMPASNLQTARQYAAEASAVDVTTQTQSSYSPSSDPSVGGNIDVSA